MIYDLNFLGCLFSKLILFHFTATYSIVEVLFLICACPSIPILLKYKDKYSNILKNPSSFVKINLREKPKQNRRIYHARDPHRADKYIR